MAETKHVALSILGIVSVIAVVGLVMLFTGTSTGQVAAPGAKLYGGDLTRGPYYETGYIRYKTNRFVEGEEFDYPERIESSGDHPVPVPATDSSYKRTGPVDPNLCPQPELPAPTTSLYAFPGCVQSEVDSAFYCCPTI